MIASRFPPPIFVIDIDLFEIASPSDPAVRCGCRDCIEYTTKATCRGQFFRPSRGG
jgi:hypothetical protein